jgi:hypothetical protein
MTSAHVAHDRATDELRSLIASWRRHLVAQRTSPATISTYSTAVGQLATFLLGHGMPTGAIIVAERLGRRCYASRSSRDTSWSPLSEAALSPTELVLAWLDEAQAPPSTYMRLGPRRRRRMAPSVVPT